MPTEPVAIAVPSEDPKAEEKSEKPKLSEEDQQIKDQVELLVSRAADSNPSISKLAVEQLVDLLRTSSSRSVASVPKPLKYVRTMYPKLEETLTSTSDAALSRRLHDVLSFVSMTLKFSTPRMPLSHKLKGTTTDLALWGHEYLRFLAGNVAEEWKERVSKGEKTDYLNTFVQQITEFMVKHQDDPSAIDLLIEIDDIGRIVPLVEESNYRRVASYIEAISRYLTRPMDVIALQTAYRIYEKMLNYTSAVAVALRLGMKDWIEDLMRKCTDKETRLQIALMCGRNKVFLTLDDEEDSLIQEANGNVRLAQIFRGVAKDLDATAPKTPEELFKNAASGKSAIPDGLYSLSCAFVSGLANCGHGTDSHLSGTSQILFEQREDRVLSTVSALGLLHLWDEEAVQELDKYLHTDNHFTKAGACLATGLMFCGINSAFDPAPSILSEYLISTNKDVMIGAILGMGYACAGTKRVDAKELLTPILADSQQPLEVQCMAAYALAMVFVGSADEDISETIINCILEIPEAQLLDVCVRYLILALGCMFLSCQEGADTLLDACSALPIPIRRYAEIVLRSCAFAGTGNVVVIQQFFHIVAENDEAEDAEAKEEEEEKDSKDANEEKAGPSKPKELNYKAAAVLGIGVVALGEHMGTEMTKRSIIHMLLADTVSHEDADMSGRRAVPLVFALLSASEPHITVIETLNRLAHDSDTSTAGNAILAMGIVAAGSNNARVTGRLASLAAYYHKPNYAPLLFVVRLSQGLCAMGRGHLTLSPLQHDRTAVSPTALMGLLGLLHSALQLDKTILERYHYMFYSITPSISPRMVVPVNGDFEVLPGVQVRVGAPVDTVAVPGKPRSITGFQTQKSPVLLSVQEKVEVADDKYVPVSNVIEGIVVLKEKEPAN